jgi:hypothetical protein
MLLSLLTKHTVKSNETSFTSVESSFDLDSKVDDSYDITYIAEETRPISGGINTAVGQNEGSLVKFHL